MLNTVHEETRDAVIAFSAADPDRDDPGVHRLRPALGHGGLVLLIAGGSVLLIYWLGLGEEEE